MRRGLAIANQEQQAYKRERVEEERHIEREIMRRVHERNQADLAAENARQEEAARRAAEHLEMVKHQMRDRDARFQQAVEQDSLALQVARQEEAYKQTVVEEARRRLLAEHAAQLQGFLPKGVLQKPEDLELIDPRRTSGGGGGGGGAGRRGLEGPRSVQW